MQLVSTIRRILPAVAVAALLFATSCASSRNKYGCPNHLQAAVNVVSVLVR